MKKIVFLLLFSFITYSTSAQNGVIITKEQSIRLLKIFMNNNGTYSTCASTGNDFRLNIHYAIKVEKNEDE